MPNADLFVALATVAVVIASVFVHYEGLAVLGRLLKSTILPHRQRIATLVLGLLLLHLLEIGLFGTTYFLLIEKADMGAIEPAETMDLTDYFYFAAVVYSTLGLGDLYPAGPIRFLVGVESVVGLLLITWSASFTFLEMQRYWGRD